MRFHWRLSIYLVLVLLTSFRSVTPQAVAEDRKRQIKDMDQSIARAGKLFKQGDFQESARLLREIQVQFGQLAERRDPTLTKALRKVHKSLKRAHVRLELEGFKLPPLQPVSDYLPINREKVNARDESEKVSFQRHVTPILVGRCGSCHIDESRGQFSMATFADLMRGSVGAGLVIFAGEPQGSRLIEVLETGDMPGGDGKVEAAELATLRRWIQQGARLDGSRPDAPLRQVAVPVDLGQAGQVPTQRASGQESVRFSVELAPVLASRCDRCHGNANPRNRFSVSTFARLWAGGSSGPPVRPGRPEESLLIAKLKGSAPGQRMPAGQNPLPVEVIRKFETWISEGGRFDGPNDNSPMGQLADLAFLSSATTEELAEKRLETATQNWHLGLPGVHVERHQSRNFLLLGNVSQEMLMDLGSQAEMVWEKLTTYFKWRRDDTPNRGRMTIYILEKRYDYSEFGKMVEQRELPRKQQGHWRHSAMDAYAVLNTGQTSATELEVVLAQQLAGLFVSGMAEVPEWFAEGLARTAVSSLGKGRPRMKKLDAEIHRAVRSMDQPDDFLEGRMPADASHLVSHGFVTFLMQNRRRYNRLIHLLHQGREFSQSFRTCYGTTPAQIAQHWVGQKPF
ncbi:MAG: hypothetical protein CMJ81_02740 [Planctomycetaceae bacterium]|nr:hypothetical protein [Planctomycetaceae bacterium]MBP62440.1 hypothetical protein [Planctomycetaceae bacterium]